LFPLRYVCAVAVGSVPTPHVWLVGSLLLVSLYHVRWTLVDSVAGCYVGLVGLCWFRCVLFDLTGYTFALTLRFYDPLRCTVIYHGRLTVPVGWLLDIVTHVVPRFHTPPPVGCIATFYVGWFVGFYTRYRLPIYAFGTVTFDPGCYVWLPFGWLLLWVTVTRYVLRCGFGLV